MLELRPSPFEEPAGQEEVLLLEEELDLGKDLMVYNDDVNTFDHVINTLVRVCDHTSQQAEQCAFIIHHKGRCSVKKGSLEQLKPMERAILDQGIQAAVI